MSSTAAESPEEHSDQKTSPKELIRYIHAQGMRAGIAIKPKTPVDVLYEIFDSDVKEEVPEVSEGLDSLPTCIVTDHCADGPRDDS